MYGLGIEIKNKRGEESSRDPNGTNLYKISSMYVTIRNFPPPSYK